MTHNNKSGSRVNQKDSTAKIRARRQTSTGQAQLKKEAPKLKKAIKSRGTSSRTRQAIKDFAPSQTAADLSNLADNVEKVRSEGSTRSNLNVSKSSDSPAEGQFVTGSGGVSPVEPNTPISDAASAFLATAAPAAVVAGGVGLAVGGIVLGAKMLAPTLGSVTSKMPAWMLNIISKGDKPAIITKAGVAGETALNTVKTNKLVKDEFAKQLRTLKTITTTNPITGKTKTIIVEELLEQSGFGLGATGLLQQGATNTGKITGSVTAQTGTGLTSGGVSKTGIRMFQVAMGLLATGLTATAGNFIFQQFQVNEGGDSASFAYGMAKTAYLDNPTAENYDNMMEGLDIYETTMNTDVSFWPFDFRGVKANAKAKLETIPIVRKATTDLEFQRINGLTDDERILKRKAEENAMFEAGQIREFQRQKELIQLKEESFQRGRKEEVRYYNKQLEKRAAFDEAEREKMAKFWFEYNKMMQQIQEDRTPSRLGFGLL